MTEQRMSRAVARQQATELVGKMTIDEQIGQLEYDAPAIARLQIPAYNYWNEALHGVARAGTATVFPQSIGLAAMFDPALVHDIGDVVATEARAKHNVAVAHGDHDIYKGLTFWSPNVNIFRDPRWGRGHETYGEDPYLTGKKLSADSSSQRQHTSVPTPDRWCTPVLHRLPTSRNLHRARQSTSGCETRFGHQCLAAQCVLDLLP